MHEKDRKYGVVFEEDASETEIDEVKQVASDFLKGRAAEDGSSAPIENRKIYAKGSRSAILRKWLIATIASMVAFVSLGYSVIMLQEFVPPLDSLHERAVSTWEVAQELWEIFKSDFLE